jgi:hypothetical protein
LFSNKPNLIDKSGLAIIIKLMSNSPLPHELERIILDDAISRDLTTARRALLIKLLCHERYLKREHLIERVANYLGKHCFGRSAWQDTFFRDMRFVKHAFQQIGYHLRYSRRIQQPGYYFQDQPALSPEMTTIIHHSKSELDSTQLHIFQRLSPADRFRMGCSTSDLALKVIADRICQRKPHLIGLEANRLALQDYYNR